VALLHLDQWCADFNLRALPFRVQRHLTAHITQVIIMHGTPENTENRRAILRLIGDLPVVCNSYQAAAEWDAGEQRADKYGLPQFRAIIHGYAASEFFNYPLAQRQREICTICSGGDTSGIYHGLPLVRRLQRALPELLWYGANPQAGLGNRPWQQNYQAYREMLAASLIYFSPTRRAPMPGARTEAALSGCCVVSVPGNDWEDYVRDGVNGYIVRTYSQAVSILTDLLAQPAEAYRVGQAGRRMAIERFGVTRLAADWLTVLREIGVQEAV
jgi:glycosyltransferase involved in cell wall biosynthesis